MLVAVFMWAKAMFQLPPAEALGIRKGEELNVNTAGAQLGGVVLRVILLVVMAVIAGLIANRGIRLYGESAASPRTVDTPKESKTS